MALLFLLSQKAALAATVAENLSELRFRCLSYVAGHAFNDTNTTTLRHGLYSQSPFSREGEVDLAASGFALASLPAAVANGAVSSNAAYQIAFDAVRQVKYMVAKSASSSTPQEIERYGIGGMLCHYPAWNKAAGEFQGQPGVEISSIDTVLLMYGLMVSANYFEGDIRADYEVTRNTIRWRDWLDTATPGHQYQFHMAYRLGPGYCNWWDWYTQEGMLLCIYASMSDPTIDSLRVWRAWKRDPITYTAPLPNSRSFTFPSTYFGDPFTVFYGLTFLDFSRLPRDVDGVDWFDLGRTAYWAHVEYFKAERGYLDDLSSGFSICSPNGAMAKPNGARQEPVWRSDATLYTVVGGLQYYSSDPASNNLARAVSGLMNSTPGFFGWHGWPVASVNATNAEHRVTCDRIVGQDVVFVGLAIDNYLTRRTQDLVLRDPAMQRILDILFPTKVGSERAAILKPDNGVRVR